MASITAYWRPIPVVSGESGNSRIFSHSFIVCEYDGITEVLHGFPLNGKIDYRRNLNPPTEEQGVDTDGANPAFFKEIQFQGTDSQVRDMANQMDTQGQIINQIGLDYYPTAYNSNTLVNTLLSHVGISLSYVNESGNHAPWAPGITNNYIQGALANYPHSGTKGGLPDLDAFLQERGKQNSMRMPERHSLLSSSYPVDLERYLGEANASHVVDPLVMDLDSERLNIPDMKFDGRMIRVGQTDFTARTSWAVGTNMILLDVEQSYSQPDERNIVGFSSGNAVAELMAMDGNGDGIVDGADTVFASLMAWKDTNGDGKISQDETCSLSSLGVVGISTSLTGLPFMDDGNQVHGTVILSMSDGSTRTAYDVDFLQSAWNTSYVGQVSANRLSAVQDLPTLAGAGTVPELSISMALNPSLEGVVRASQGQIIQSSMISAAKDTDAILMRWTGATSFTPYSLGEFGDARWLHGLMAFTGAQVDTTVPITPGLGVGISDAWGHFVSGEMSQLLVQGSLGQLLNVSALPEYGMMEAYSSRSSIESTLVSLSSDLVSLSDRALYWSSALSVMSLVDRNAGFVFGGESTGLSIHDMAVQAGFDKFEGALATPLVLAPGYYHRPFGDSLLITSDAGNIMSVGNGNHIVVGGAGDDLFRPGSGSNLIDLGGGTNTLTYDLNYESYTIDMAAGTTVKPDGTIDHFTNVQRLVGTRDSDDITGSSGNDWIDGIAGSITQTEHIHAGAGDDVVYGYDTINPWLGQGLVDEWGEDGNDILIGTNSTNRLDGGNGNDILYGLEGDDTLVGGSGDDLLDGAGGYDTADYSSDPSAVSVEMAYQVYTSNGYGGTAVDGWGSHDTLVSIERVLGTSGMDFMAAGQAAVTLEGGAGGDTYAIRPWSGNLTIVDGVQDGPGDVDVLLVQGAFDPSAFSETVDDNDLLLSFGAGMPTTRLSDWMISSAGHQGVQRVEFIDAGTVVQLLYPVG